VTNDDRTRELDISAWLPAPRAAPDDVATVVAAEILPDIATEPAAPVRAKHSAADETMLLPIFLTGLAPTAGDSAPAVPEPEPPAAPPQIPKRAPDDRLPSDERNMLIFVSMLLLLGTLAIVAMASVGR
jgi:hypothetical protein